MLKQGTVYLQEYIKLEKLLLKNLQHNAPSHLLGTSGGFAPQLHDLQNYDSAFKLHDATGCHTTTVCYPFFMLHKVIGLDEGTGFFA
jgi:hypothetical protein